MKYDVTEIDYSIVEKLFKGPSMDQLKAKLEQANKDRELIEKQITELEQKIERKNKTIEVGDKVQVVDMSYSKGFTGSCYSFPSVIGDLCTVLGTGVYLFTKDCFGNTINLDLAITNGKGAYGFISSKFCRKVDEN
jgi:hypothetical protein